MAEARRVVMVEAMLETSKDAEIEDGTQQAEMEVEMGEAPKVEMGEAPKVEMGEAPKVEATEMIDTTKGIKKGAMVQMVEANLSATNYVGSKNVKIEERLMYGDLDTHECVRMLVTCCFEYEDKASDLEWMCQICLRELCKLEKRTREEVVTRNVHIA